MNCHACGSAMGAEENYCPVCGAKAAEHNETAATATATGQPVESQPLQPQPVEQTSAQTSPPLDSQVKQFTSDYFAFVWESFKAPGKIAANANASSKLPGLITLGILIIFMPLLDYLRLLIHASAGPNLNLGALGDFGELAEMFGLPGLYQPSFGYDFLRPLIVTAISLELIITVIYVTSSILKSSLSFMDVTSRFGAAMVVPTAVLLLAGLLSLIGLGPIVAFVHSFGMLGVAVAILFTTHTFNQEQTKIDSFYVGAIVLAVSYLLYSLVQIVFA